MKSPTEGKDSAFETLLTYLKDQRGFDFTGYKRSTLLRRFQRQMVSTGCDSFEEYADYLQTHPEHFVELFNGILINVTSFFRDPESWAHLSDQLLPTLLSRRQDGPIRAWSAGCATGEEAFSLAILLAETLGLDEYRHRVKIYATDVDEEALTFARQATFDTRALRGLTPERIETWFETDGDRHVLRKELRRSVIFGRNDLVQDAPISHVDLLMCRNTLMYFNAETQTHILNRLHFGLKPDGVLFLGKAEMLLSHSELFAPIELKLRFFRKVDDPGARDRRRTLAAYGWKEPTSGELARVREEAFLSSPTAQIVIDSAGRLAMTNHRAESLFGLATRDVGRPFQDLEVSYRPLELRSWVEEASRAQRTVWVREVEWQRATGETLTFDVQVVPLLDGDSTSLGATVIFNDVTRFRQLQGELEYTNRQLEAAYEELQSTNEELETTNEELQSTVEELETTNEELQSTNEELETMNEELQSMNDELQFTNEELRGKSTDLERANDFLGSVLTSLRSGVAVVDTELSVLAWNHQAEELWGVREKEALGEHLLNLDIGLPAESLRPILRSQLAGERSESGPVELAAVNRRGRHITLSVTVTPLLRDDSQVAGAILLMDVTDE